MVIMETEKKEEEERSDDDSIQEEGTFNTLNDNHVDDNTNNQDNEATEAQNNENFGRRRVRRRVRVIRRRRRPDESIFFLERQHSTNTPDTVREIHSISIPTTTASQENSDLRLIGLPIAYPARSNNRIIEPVSVIPMNPSSSRDRNRNRSNENETPSNEQVQHEWFSHKKMKIFKIVYVLTIIICVSVAMMVIAKKPKKSDKVQEAQTDIEGQKDYSNNAENSTKISGVIRRENFTCYTDPMVINTKELEMFENGEDPSIPRTYHICPNTIIYPYDTDSKKFAKIDYTSGLHYPLTLFRPNVSILCGRDGALENNCTFQGGFSSIWIRPKVMQYDYLLQNTTAENMTIMGVTFLGGSSGTTIFIANIKGSLTIRDCYFHNYNGLSQSIGVRNIHELEEFSLNVENCTFENNTYSHPDLTLYQFFNNFNSEQRRFIDYNSVSCIHVVSPFPKLRIHSSKFLNNHFVSMMDNNNSSTTQGDELSITTALINMEWSEDDLYYSRNEGVASLEVTDSHFIENIGYSTLISFDTSQVHGENYSFQRSINYNVLDNILMKNTP